MNFLRRMIMKLFFATIALAGLLAAEAAPESFIGVITDTMCGSSHTMLKGQPDQLCIKACVKARSGYALFEGKNVLKLSDQNHPRRCAGQRVKVPGVRKA